MRISIFEATTEERGMLEPLLPADATVQWHEEPLTLDNVSLARDADAISVFVKSTVTRAALDTMPNCKLIATRSMGYDHIDIATARERAIAVQNVTTYAAHPVAEFTFALLLTVARNIYPAYNRLREGGVFSTRGLGGFNLSGKTLGVLGTGRIGRTVIGIARGFGMRIIATDAKPDAAFAVANEVTYVPFDELLAQSDIITIHVPALPETFHMLGAAEFARMKKGVVVINTARGDVIDTRALVAAVRNGTVRGAGLDVLEQERALTDEPGALVGSAAETDFSVLTANHILIDMPNVIVTPHIAYETTEAIQEISRVTAETISAFGAGTLEHSLTT